MSKIKESVMFITSDERAYFANTELTGLIRNFAMGEIRSVLIITTWCDGEVGGSYHIEGDKAKLLAHADNVIGVLGALPSSTT